MGISISKTNLRTNASDFLDIASSGVFKNYWLVAARELNLDLIEQFPAFFPCNEDKEELIRQLQLVGQWATQRGSTQVLQSVASKAQLVIEFVDRVDWENEELCVG